MLPTTLVSLSTAATVVLSLSIPNSILGPSLLYPTVQLAVIPENHIREGTINARDYTVEYFTENYAMTTAFCNDWLARCSKYVKHLGGHPSMDCVRSQAGPVVKVFCGGTMKLKGLKIHSDFTDNCMRFVSASMQSGPESASTTSHCPHPPKSTHSKVKMHRKVPHGIAHNHIGKRDVEDGHEEVQLGQGVELLEWIVGVASE